LTTGEKEFYHEDNYESQNSLEDGYVLWYT